MSDADAPGPLAGRRVLIVEDRYLIASELGVQVRSFGAEVAGMASSVASGLALLESCEIDLALLDVNLEGELVFALAEALAQAGKPFIFLTGYDQWVLPAKWQDRPRLAKPVTGQALFHEMIKLLPALG